MARLKRDEIVFIVQRLACFEKPTEIQTQLRETFGIEVGLPQILYYDPKSRGTDMAQKWRRMFSKTRAQFIRSSADIPIAHRTYRLQKLQKLIDKAETQGHTLGAGQLLIQAAKEMGDAYTNRRVLMPADETAIADELAKMLGVDRDELLAAVAGTTN